MPHQPIKSSLPTSIMNLCCLENQFLGVKIHGQHGAVQQLNGLRETRGGHCGQSTVVTRKHRQARVSTGNPFGSEHQRRGDRARSVPGEQRPPGKGRTSGLFAEVRRLIRAADLQMHVMSCVRIPPDAQQHNCVLLAFGVHTCSCNRVILEITLSQHARMSENRALTRLWYS